MLQGKSIIPPATQAINKMVTKTFLFDTSCAHFPPEYHDRAEISSMYALLNQPRTFSLAWPCRENGRRPDPKKSSLRPVISSGKAPH